MLDHQKIVSELENPRLDTVNILEELANRFLDLKERQELADALMIAIANEVKRKNLCPRCFATLDEKGECESLICDYEEGE